MANVEYGGGGNCNDYPERPPILCLKHLNNWMYCKQLGLTGCFDSGYRALNPAESDTLGGGEQ